MKGDLEHHVEGLKALDITESAIRQVRFFLGEHNVTFAPEEVTVQWDKYGPCLRVHLSLNVLRQMRAQGLFVGVDLPR